jgi:hypothetical protein
MGEALTASEAEEFMREADLNGDGKLDYDEFARIMSQSIRTQLLKHTQNNSIILKINIAFYNFSRTVY